jgi:hypothetical protein
MPNTLVDAGRTHADEHVLLADRLDAKRSQPTAAGS